MRFSDAFEVTPTNDDDWFDVTLELDSNLFVDPFLIYQDDSAEWQAAHDHILRFFAMVFDCVQQAGGSRTSPPWRVAEHLMLFPEPAEFCLGVAASSPFGAGSGRGLERDMLDSISTAIAHGMNGIPHMEYLSILAGGIGHDRISDMACNILKAHFIKYTQEICRRHNIPMANVKVKHADWSFEHYGWLDKTVELPLNPMVSRPLGVLLTPEAFIRDIPVATAQGFWSFAQGAAELRDRFNFDLARNAPRHQRAEVSRNYFSLIDDYFANLERQRHNPYSIDDDPRRRLDPGATRASVFASYPAPALPLAASQVPEFVGQLVENFRYCMEDKGLSRRLWYKGHGLEERVAQDLFHLTVVMFCRHNNILVTPESNAGRGPVDFTFSQGWKDRALVELKLVRNTAFWDGIMKQVPTYSRAEDIHAAYFVGIAYTDEELSAASTERVQQAAALASERNGIAITPLIIDARRQLSGSRVRMTPEEREELRAARLGRSD
jgi:hypothetical protein